MRKAVILDYTEQDSFLPSPSPSLLLWVKDVGKQPESSESIDFLQAQVLSMFNILDQTFFFLINYPAPSVLFIQCKVTVKCHLIIKGNSMHSFCNGVNTQLC